MPDHQNLGISDEQLWGTYHATRKNTEEIDRLSAQLVVLNNRVTAQDIKLADHGNRIDDCKGREDDNKDLIISVKNSIDGLHNALIDERKVNLQLQETVIIVPTFWTRLGQWTQIMAAIGATGVAFGILWAMWHFGVRYAIEH